VTAATSARPVPSARRLGWITMAAVLVVALFIGVNAGVGPTSASERAHNLSEQIMCPVCDGQSVADSGSSASSGIRQYISKRIGEGASDDQIRDELADQYGQKIILTPGRSGIASLVWTLPVAVLIAAVAGVALAFRRWRHQAEARATEADRALVGQALDDLRRDGGGG
jgi:cytochrome c-type biogenesis protein CcmH